MAEALNLPQLIEALRALDRLGGLARVREGRRLVEVARVSVSAAADEGAWQATRPRGTLTRKAAAEELGAAYSALNDAVSRHIARIATVRPVGRTADAKRARTGRSHRE
jgi:hypothetical protein